MTKNGNNNQLVETHSVAVAEVESQIATAKRYPRDITKFKDKLMTMANLDQQTAEGCYYSLPRAGKAISGPSVRFAEIALSCYGNCVASADIVNEDDNFIYAEGMCRDLENNVAIRMTVRRRITNKYGQRYNDDLIVVTANAACAIALRNAIFKIVPGAYIKAAFDQVRETAVGKAESFANRRAVILERLGKLGVDEDRVLYSLGRACVDDITVNDAATLIGLGTAIHDGDTTLDEAFPARPKEQPQGNEALKETLKKKNGKAKKARPEPKEQAEEDIPDPDPSIQEPPGAPKYMCFDCEAEFDEPKKSGKNKETPLCPKCLSKNITATPSKEEAAA
jgi:DNA-directed RNA polymerase subunit RPC12/RpoP